MTNGNIKTVLTRRSLQWDEFLDKIQKEIEENGFPRTLWKPEIERLILRHSHIQLIKKDIIEGFKGIKKVKPEVNEWLKGVA